MASVIRNGTPTAGAVLFVDEYSSFPEPLLNRLGRGVRVVRVDEETAARKEADALRGRPTVIWFWRHTHDTSPGGFVTGLQKELSQGRTVRRYDYLPYSQPERWILYLLRGPGQPGYFYRLSEMHCEVKAVTSSNRVELRGDEQRAQVTIAALADPEQHRTLAAGVLARRARGRPYPSAALEPDQGHPQDQHDRSRLPRPTGNRNRRLSGRSTARSRTTRSSPKRAG
jgi:hypothetical protein